MSAVDVVVIGGGIAGISVAATLPPELKVVVIERESSLTHHSTGRSAAVLLEGLGGSAFSALTSVGVSTLAQPDPDFSEVPFIEPRGLVTLDVEGHEPEDVSADIANSRLTQVQELDIDAIVELVPWVDPRLIIAGRYQQEVFDLDVAGLHQAYVRQARRNGVEIVRNCEALTLDTVRKTWTVDTPQRRFSAPTVVNAAGAWGDVVAEFAGVSKVGLVAKRRTAFTVAAPGVRGGPMIDTSAADFYAKPESGEQLLLSPMDKTPVEPCDVRHEEIDVARTIEIAQPYLLPQLRTVRTAWAGLRTFAPDQHPVIGWGDREGFFWMCGQGGTGIQSAPGAAACAVSLLLGHGVPRDAVEAGLDPVTIDPLRFL
ncbi:MAG: FAD-binding oxidoreductase [Acidimicrobiales bacterium]|nr:FAD-binding oxidoreductase [Acidimicrobiales bacterium]